MRGSSSTTSIRNRMLLETSHLMPICELPKLWTVPASPSGRPIERVFEFKDRRGGVWEANSVRTRNRRASAIRSGTGPSRRLDLPERATRSFGVAGGSQRMHQGGDRRRRRQPYGGARQAWRRGGMPDRTPRSQQAEPEQLERPGSVRAEVVRERPGPATKIGSHSVRPALSLTPLHAGDPVGFRPARQRATAHRPALQRAGRP